MLLDNWDIDLDEVIESNYTDGTVLRLRDLILFVLEHPNETRQKFGLSRDCPICGDNGVGSERWGGHHPSCPKAKSA